MRNHLHRFIRPSSIDGFLVVSTTISNYTDSWALAETFRDVIAHIPVVTVGAPHPGVSSISVDNRSGVREVIRHLIEAHGRRRFVFIAGHGDNFDGTERKSAFLDTLAEYGLEPVEAVPVRGDFNYGVALRSFRLWLDRGIPFDAVIAANDESAYACYDAMCERSIKVPEDVSLAGFDDIINSRFYEVPLTTVSQPIREIGYSAIRQLHRAIEDGASPVQLVFPTTAVIRQSCGCFSEAASAASGISTSISGASDPFSLGDGALSLENAFRAVIAEPACRSDFLGEFQALLQRTPPGPQSFTAFEGLIASFERILWDARPEGVQASVQQGMPSGVQAGETALHQARLLIMRKAESYQANRGIAYQHRNRQTQYAIARLMTSFSFERLLAEIDDLVPHVGIRSCFISLFTPDSNHERSNLVFAHRDGTRLSLPPGGIAFDTEEFVPRGLIPSDRRFGLFVDTLFHDEMLIGLLVLDIDIAAEIWNDAVTNQFRSALRASLLMDELVAKDERLNATFGELSARAGELERANVRIRDDQERIIMAEKMASIGRLTAGIAHEMNTPLAALRASLSETSKLVGEYRASVGDSDVTREDHLAIAEEMERSLTLAMRSAERAAGFIRSIKGQTRTHDQKEAGVTFDLAKGISDSLVLLAHELRRGKCRVDFNAPEKALLTVGKPDRLVQVVTNLVMNAIDAMSPSGGAIALTLVADKDRAVMTVSDSGAGMDAETQKRIFDPLFTTKPFGEGTGLGLTIVHDIITGDFRGTIDVTSAPGKGSSFTVTIPLI
jgi:DNA-binding LacI/PurR family transcriptional regulator/signal transduction histidine kinase